MGEFVGKTVLYIRHYLLFLVLGRIREELRTPS